MTLCGVIRTDRLKTADEIDIAILRALIADPSATTLAISATTGLARNTVRARLNRYDSGGALESFERRIAPAFLGYPLTAFITTIVRQSALDAISSALARVPEVLEAYGIAGSTDLLIRVVAKDADDLYRTAGRILAIDGVERTDTGIVMRDLIRYRIRQIL